MYFTQRRAVHRYNPPNAILVAMLWTIILLGVVLFTGG
jgi:hypothetical protein